MCGILGYISKNNYSEKSLREALRLIEHRGPDYQSVTKENCGEFYVGFGHVRLSVIDLSDHASQPFESSCGRFSLVYNGEIYNFKELRDELEQLGFLFRTHSDTEVLINAWSAWGVDILPRLVGMFSFIILDRNELKIHLVRDAFAIKPLFYSFENGELFFGSDLFAFMKLRDKEVQPDLQKAYDYLVHDDYDSSPSTFVEGVKHLSPGHFLEFDLLKGVLLNSQCWWQPDLTYTSKLSFEQAAKKLRVLFLDSLNLHLRSDVPFGVALSGGIDSSAIACGVRYLEPDVPINTFSYIATDKKISEEQWVDQINEFISALPNKVISSSDDIQSDLDDMLLKQGEPFGGTSIYAQYRVFRMAKQCGVTVTLDGQGADELLAGYSGYPGHRLLSLLETRGLFAAHRFARQWSQFPGRSYFLAWQYFARLMLPDGLYALARRWLGRDFTPVWLNTAYLSSKGVQFKESRPALSAKHRGKRVKEALAYSLTGRGLPSLLRHGDRNSMAFSIESRVPFLTIPLAEFLLSLPEEYLISNDGETKHVFREAMRGIVPDETLDRKDKIGFATPESEWLLGMSETIRSWIQGSPELPFIDKKEIIKEFDDIVNQKRKFDGRVWRWINYLRWCSLMGIK